MGMSVTMWRLDEDEASRGLNYLESRFVAALDEEEWGEGTDFAGFCAVGEVWDSVNIAISRDRIPVQGVESLVILGGALLGTVGGPSDLITMLDRQEVVEVSHFLDGLNVDLLIAARDHFRGLPDFVISEVRRRIGDLQSFYALAAQEGQLVAKRVYGP